MGRKQKKIEQIESIVNEEANKNYVPVILTMNKIIAAVKEELVNFVPSVGTKTLADIDSRAKELIKKIQNSKEFAELMKDKERKTELKEPVLLLSRTRATRWDTQAFFAVQLIEAKAKFIIADDRNKKTVQAVENMKVWQ